MNDYNWPGQFKPFAHQKVTAQFLAERPRAFCFNEQGTGKTASVIWAADYLMSLGLLRRVLVVCPLSIMKSAWQNDLFKFAVHRTCDIAYGDRKKRVKIINNGAEFVIINFDGLAIVKDEVLNAGFDLIVVDEASAYKNPTTERWKVLRDLNKKIKGLWMLTGTPAAQSPVDAFGLAKLVNPTGVTPFFGQFRDQVMLKVGMYRWIPKPNAQETVHNALQPAIRFEKDQCLDLPEVTYVERDAPLTAQQKKYYKILKDNMIMEAAGEEISSANAATSINKLLQISGGAVYTDTKDIVEFDVSNRLQVILEVVEESSHKVLIFVPFTHTIELLNAYLMSNKIAC
jgi:SNF2 family DNA or RNA helicase